MPKNTLATKPLTREQAVGLFYYDPILRGIRWRVKLKHSGKYIGDVAGFQSGTHMRVGVSRNVYFVHHIVWLMAYGAWPKTMLDHKDGNGYNNAIWNLREANESQNAENQRKATSKNSSGYLGVVARTSAIRRCPNIKKRYSAKIHISGRNIWLGHFETALEAHEVYLAFKRMLHEFCTI